MVREVLPPTRSTVAAIGAVMAGVGCAVLTVGIVWDAGLPTTAKLGALAIGCVFAAGLLLIGLKLLGGGGGVVVDDEGGRLGIGVTSRRDTWWIPRAEIVGLRVIDDDARATNDDAAWLAALQLRDGSAVVMARDGDRQTVRHVVGRLSEALGVTALPDAAEVNPGDAGADVAGDVGAVELAEGAPSAVPPLGDVVAKARFAVRRGAALQWVLFFFGLSMFIVGVVMIGQVEERPVFGFIFGPLLAVLGLVLLAVAVVKRLAVEELTFDGATWVHAFGIGRLRWSERRMHSAAPVWRIQIHALRGAHLELVGRDGILVMASGATTRSTLDLATLAQLPRRFAAPGG